MFLVWHPLPLFGIGRRFLLERILGHSLAYSVLMLSHFFEARLGVRLDHIDRTFRLANPAIDTLVGMDHEHILALVEAVHGADFDAVGVLALDADFSDDVRHLSHLA